MFNDAIHTTMLHSDSAAQTHALGKAIGDVVTSLFIG